MDAQRVAPHAGAWIETNDSSEFARLAGLSLWSIPFSSSKRAGRRDYICRVFLQSSAGIGEPM